MSGTSGLDGTSATGGKGGAAAVPGPRTGPGVVEAVCVTHAVKADPGIIGRTGIDKRPVDAVEVGVHGVAGDVVADHLHHGGPDKAVYVYAAEDAAWWSDELGVDVPAGWFGENLRLRGVAASEAVIGERWRVGEEVVLEVTQPRIPCATFGRHVGQERWVKRFSQAGRVGAYLRVLAPGTVRAGDQVVVDHVPQHGVTVQGWFARQDPADARTLLAAGEQGLVLAPSLVAYVERSLGRA